MAALPAFFLFTAVGFFVAGTLGLYIESLKLKKFTKPFLVCAVLFFALALATGWGDLLQNLGG